MWANGPFARPVSSFEAPVPPIGVDPTEGPFFYVAINQAWMPAVIGCLFQLLLQTTWTVEDDEALNLAQLQAFNLIQQFQIATNQCPAGSYPIPIAESEYEMSLCEQLRFQNGKLQALCCGEWTDIAGQGANLAVGAPDQPGDGLPQPTPGGCQTYHGKMPANVAWNLPAGVSTGDIITVTNVEGATYDGGYSSWRCWEGDTFFLGACIPGTGGTRTTDPLPSVKHMRLLANINGVFYDATSPITVPSGVANAPVNFQVNDDVLSDNGGDLAFDVEVCNNQPVTAIFTHHFDFRVSTYGFQLYLAGGSTAHWVAGVGFEVTSGGVSGDNIIGAYLLNSTTLTNASERVQGTRSAASIAGDVIQGWNATVTTLIESHPIPVGAGTIDSGFIPFTLSFQSPGVTFNAGPTAGDTAVLTDFYVQAEGVDPF